MVFVRRVFAIGLTVVAFASASSTSAEKTLAKQPSHMLSLIRQPVPASQKDNFFQDIDGDGTLDQITLSLLGPIDSNYLKNQLDSMVYTWVDSSGHIKSYLVKGTDFTIDSKNPKRLVYKIPNPKAFYSYLTDIDTTHFGVYGRATMYANSPGDGQSVLPILMTDGMAPVIREAILRVADNDNSNDILTLTFSEPAQIYSGASDKELFEIKAPGSSDTRILHYSEILWKSNRTVELTFGKSIRLDQRPSSLDSIRFNTNTIADFAGNVVPSDAEYVKQGGASAKPFKVVVGDIRFKLTTVPKVSFNPSDPSIRAAQPIVAVVREYGSAANVNQDQGLIIDLGSRDLLFTLQQAIKNKKFANDSTLLIENIPVDTSKIRIRLELSLFTSSGDFVASKEEQVDCGDARFLGNCIDHPKQIFLQWNFKSQNGRVVGSGVYYAQMRIHFWYDSSPAVNVVDREKLEAWGVIRMTGNTALRQ